MRYCSRAKSLGRGGCGDRPGGERLPEPGKKVKILAANIDNMENRSRWDNIDVPNLEEGTGGNTLSTFSKPGLPLCYHTTVLPSG